MALLKHERQELKTRLLKALRSGHQIALPEKYQADLKEVTGQDFPATVGGLLEHLGYIEDGGEVKPEPVVEAPVEAAPEVVKPEPVVEAAPEVIKPELEGDVGSLDDEPAAVSDAPETEPSIEPASEELAEEPTAPAKEAKPAGKKSTKK
jgi:hypothetical protein